MWPLLVNSSPSLTRTMNLSSHCQLIPSRFTLWIKRATKNRTSSVILSHHLTNITRSWKPIPRVIERYRQWHTLSLYAWYTNQLYTEYNYPGLIWWYRIDSSLDNYNNPSKHNGFPNVCYWTVYILVLQVATSSFDFV